MSKTSQQSSTDTSSFGDPETTSSPPRLRVAKVTPSTRRVATVETVAPNVNVFIDDVWEATHAHARVDVMCGLPQEGHTMSFVTRKAFASPDDP
jgi:hypothetical protein